MEEQAKKRRGSAPQERFFSGDQAELQEIKSRERLQNYHRHQLTGQRRTRAMQILLFCVICLVFAVLVLHYLFRVEKIEVEGTERYDAETVVEASGLKTGGSIFAVGNGSVAGLPETLPYLYSAKIARRLPNTIVITVTEDSPAYWCELYGEYFVLSTGLRVLERRFVPEFDGMNIKQLALPEVDYAIVGTVIRFDSAADEKYVRSYLGTAEVSEVYKRITAIDLRDRFDLAVLCGEHYYVTLGDSTDLATKFSTLEAVFETPAFTEGTTYEIDASDPAQPSALPGEGTVSLKRRR